MRFFKDAGRHRASYDIDSRPFLGRAECSCGWSESGFPVPLDAVTAIRKHMRRHGADGGWSRIPDLSIPSLQGMTS